MSQCYFADRSMIDRFGKTIIIGWSEHEVLWLEAALSLPAHQQIPAFRDLSSMTGRSVAAIQHKASWLVEKAAIADQGRRLLIVARSYPCPQRARA